MKFNFFVKNGNTRHQNQFKHRNGAKSLPNTHYNKIQQMVTNIGFYLQMSGLGKKSFLYQSSKENNWCKFIIHQ